MSRATQLAEIQNRITAACHKAGRPGSAVKLLAVSKTFPLSDILEFYSCGQTAFGENYLQEALDKITQLADHPNAQTMNANLEWHFIGPIQSNKTKAISEHFDWVHTVATEAIADRLNKARPEALPPLNICIQVNLDNEDTKSGVNVADVLSLATHILTLPNLKLRGLMTIPRPETKIPQQIASFQRLTMLFTDINLFLKNPMDTLSMGMSTDFKAAIQAGSTLVRVGTAIFGSRTT